MWLGARVGPAGAGVTEVPARSPSVREGLSSPARRQASIVDWRSAPELCAKPASAEGHLRGWIAASCAGGPARLGQPVMPFAVDLARSSPDSAQEVHPVSAAMALP